MQMFLEYIKHLFLFYHFFQYGRVFFVGDTQQQTVIIFYDVEQLDKTCAGQQVTIIVIYRISQCIIIGVYRAGGFQQFYLIVHSPFAEYPYGFGGMAFGTAERDVLGYDFLHPLLDCRYVFQLNGTSDAEIAEIALGYGMLYKQLSFREQFADSLI